MRAEVENMQDSWQTGVRVKGQGSPREQRPPCSQRRLAAAQREHFAATQSVALRSGRCSSQTLSITAAAFPVCSGTFIGIMCPVLRNTAGSNRVSGQGGAAGVSAGASQQQHIKLNLAWALSVLSCVALLGGLWEDYIICECIR